MTGKVPRIVERFPARRQQLLEARRVDPVIDAMCQDYDEVMEQLPAGETALKLAEQSIHTDRDLVRLAQEIEQEILARFGTPATPEADRKCDRSFR